MHLTCPVLFQFARFIFARKPVSTQIASIYFNGRGGVVAQPQSTKNDPKNEIY